MLRKLDYCDDSLVFAARAKGRDFIYIVKDRHEKKLTFPEIAAVYDFHMKNLIQIVICAVVRGSYQKI